MSIQEFSEKLRTELEEKMDGLAEVRLEHVIRNNGTERIALCILLKGQNTAPALYMEDFYERHNRGVSDRELILEIMKILRDNCRTRYVPDSFMSRKDAEPKLRAMLINGEKNEYRRRTCPHRDLMDLMICYYIFLEDDDRIGRMAVVTGKLAEIWGMSEDDLYHAALSNMRGEPPHFESIRDCLKEYCSRLCEDDSSWKHIWGDAEENELPKLYVLSNRVRHMGASEILVPGRLADCCRRMNADRIYILPSSIHEVLLLKADDRFSPGELVRIVREVNREAVSEEERLSDSLYEYDWISGKLMRAEPERSEPE